MKQRTANQKRLLLIAFAALALLLGLLIWQGVRRGDAARVGIPHSAAASGAAMLLQSPAAQYSCAVGSTAQVLAAALEKGDLDAALLPAQLASGMDGVEIRAVVGYTPLVILSEQPEINRLDDLAGCTLVYGASGDPFACSLDAAAKLNTPIRFSLSKAWRQSLGSLPPAGLCLAVRQDYLAQAGTDFDAFERALKSAMAYGADKRKKTVAMAAAAGLAPDEDTADRLYPFCDFVYLTGAEMRAALQAGAGNFNKELSE